MSSTTQVGEAPRATSSSEAPSPLKQPEFVKLLAISVTVALGFGMVVPVLALYAQSFGVSLAAIGLVQLTFGLTRFGFGLVGGLVVDRFGERACTIAGLLIVSASSYAAGFAQSFPQFVLARGFGGAGSALFMAGLMNRILRLVEPAAMGRATGQFRSSFLVGIALGPFLGGLAASRFGLAAPFHLYATGLLAAAAIAWLAMKQGGEIARTKKRTPLEALTTARPLLADRRYLVALAAMFAGWWSLSGPAQTIGPLFARNELGFSAGQIGVAVTMLAVGEILILLVAGRAADRYGRRAVLVPSLAATALATGVMGQIGGATWAYYPTMMILGAGVAAGGAAVGGLLADAIPREGSGAAVGVNQMAGDLGYLISPALIGLIAEHLGFPSAYLVGAVPAALVLVVALRSLPRTTRADGSNAPVRVVPPAVR
jgi:MFS transporter, DHA1 family, multidrug resistance protein